MKEQDFTYGLLLNGEALSGAYKVTAIPTIYVIGRDGRIVHAERGYRDGAETDLANVIEKAMKWRSLDSKVVARPDRAASVAAGRPYLGRYGAPATCLPCANAD